MSNTILSAVDTLGDARYKIEIAQSLYSGLMYQFFDDELNTTRNNEAAFFNLRDDIKNGTVALMEFVMQAYRDVTTVLETLEAEREKSKQ